MSWIITKYADTNFPSGKAPIGWSVLGSYTARECGIVNETYASPIEAADDLAKLREFNPSVGYGLVEVDDDNQT